MNKSYLLGAIIVGLIIALVFITTSEKDKSVEMEIATSTALGVEIVAENLSVPWDIGFLPDGDLLVTERPGTIRRVGNMSTEISVPGIIEQSESGLLGLVLHPNFETNNYLYLYETYQVGDNLRNRVMRYMFSNNLLTEPEEIISDIPGALYHDGGRLRFGPDNLLYITTGDATQDILAQDVNSLAGKVLRLTDDGSIPEDNPFGNEVYSLGHRNPQGIAWDSEGNLWETEHGRSGLQSGFDEINLIVSGHNYGWPDIEGNEIREGMQNPRAHSGTSDTWAPASLIYFNDSLWFGGLKGEALYQAKLSGTEVLEVVEHFKGEYGRIRTIVLGPDNFFYITTSNTDGRGNVKNGDDKIIKVNPDSFQ